MEKFEKLGFWVVLVGSALSFLHPKAIASEVSSYEQPGSVVQISQAVPAPLPPDAVKVGTEGSWAVQKDTRNTIVMPTGDVVEPGGIVTFREGFKAQVIYRDGKPVGYQLFTINGRKLTPGEALVFQDGTKLEQPRF